MGRPKGSVNKSRETTGVIYRPLEDVGVDMGDPGSSDADAETERGLDGAVKLLAEAIDAEVMAELYASDLAVWRVTSYERTEPEGTAWQVEREGFAPDMGFATPEQAECYATAMYGECLTVI